MSTWKSALTLTVAAAMVATTAFAQSGGSGSTTAPGAKQPDGGASATTPSTGATKPDTTSPSASPSTPSMSTPSASPGTSTTDPAKSDTMKSDTMKSEKGRMGAAAGGNREQVKAVQQALKDKGHDPGTVDGVMGPKTRGALKDFQKKEGIKDTGRLDQETMTKLGVEEKTSSTTPAPGSASPTTSSPSASPSGSGATEKK
jgi:peptidoglycan hydrolase-like protein with peptidoglycan-binding domain